MQKSHQVLQFVGGQIERGHSGIWDAVQNGVAKASFAFHARAPGVADGGSALASQTVLAVTAGASNIESRASGFHGVGRRGRRGLGEDGAGEEGNQRH